MSSAATPDLDEVCTYILGTPRRGEDGDIVSENTPCRRLAASVVGDSNADEVLQRVCMALFEERRAPYDLNRGPLEAWCKCLVRGFARDWLRERRRRDKPVILKKKGDQKTVRAHTVSLEASFLEDGDVPEASRDSALQIAPVLSGDDEQPLDLDLVAIWPIVREQLTSEHQRIVEMLLASTTRSVAAKELGDLSPNAFDQRVSRASRAARAVYRRLKGIDAQVPPPTQSKPRLVKARSTPEAGTDDGQTTETATSQTYEPFGEGITDVLSAPLEHKPAA